MTISERRILNNKIRRRRQLRSHMLLGFATIALICILVISLGSFLSRAESKEKTVFHKYYKSIQIEAGDTLWQLARENMGSQYKDIPSYVQEVMKMNAMPDDTLIAGEYIIIPYYSYGQ